MVKSRQVSGVYPQNDRNLTAHARHYRCVQTRLGGEIGHPPGNLPFFLTFSAFRGYTLQGIP